MATTNIIRFFFNNEGDYVPFNSIGGHGYPRKDKTSGDNPAILMIPPEGVKAGYYRLHLSGGGILDLWLTGEGEIVDPGVWVAEPDHFPDDKGFIEVNWTNWEELI